MGVITDLQKIEKIIKDFDIILQVIYAPYLLNKNRMQSVSEDRDAALVQLDCGLLAIYKKFCKIAQNAHNMKKEQYSMYSASYNILQAIQHFLETRFLILQPDNE